jgi:cytochrome d ubiquinol oxidase subunit II
MDVLPTIWYGIVLAEFALYVLLDGANLGVGILSLFPQEEKMRSLMMNMLGPIWNANETWLLVAAGTLFGAFPAVYAIGMNALAVPGVLIVVALILRAVSFEFHAYATRKEFWVRTFGVASALLAVGHGFLVGGLLSGIAIADGHFAGGPWDWATPITALMTLGIVFGYTVLGYARLIRTSHYELQILTFRRLIATAGVAVAALIATTFFLPRTNYVFFERWTETPSMYLLWAIVVCIVIVSAFLTYSVVTHRHTERIYLWILAVVVFGVAGMVVGTYPYLVPGQVTIWDAASPSSTLRFMLWGIGPILPIVLLYQWYLAHIFAGRAEEY